MVSAPSLADGSSTSGAPVTFSTIDNSVSDLQAWFRDGLAAELQRRGFELSTGGPSESRLVLNVTDYYEPQSFRRKSQGTFGIAIVELTERPDDFIRACYPVLVRSLSQVGICLLAEGDNVEAHFMTMEQGHYVLTRPPGGDDAAFFAAVHDRIEPLVTSRYVIQNIFNPDLPKDLWDGDEISDQLIEAGRKLDALNLLPAPWPIDDLLDERERRHVKRLFQIGGLSYGNISARRDEDTFWMSASGVNKGKLKDIGRDVLLVTGFDEEEYAMVLSVPENVEPRRVSVDAIEHYMIYQEHPSVGAIIHVHAWMDGIKSTHINYPCGTRELAVAVAELVRQEPDPSRTVIGLKNHGVTITGHSLPEIFDRIEGKLINDVPMT
ncbi:class II aldolase/adducin family protein [soil metagenome]